MQTYKQDIAAAASWRLGVPGSYFRLLGLTGPVDVQFLRHGTVIFTAGQVLDGFWSKPEGGFDEVIITSASAQTVTLGITTGDAGYDRAAGSVAVTNVNGSFTATQKTVLAIDGQLLPGNPSRRYLLIQNNHATSILYIKFGATAATTTNTVKIQPGGSYELQGFAPTDEIRAVGSASLLPIVVEA